MNLEWTDDEGWIWFWNFDAAAMSAIGSENIWITIFSCEFHASLRHIECIQSIIHINSYGNSSSIEVIRSSSQFNAMLAESRSWGFFAISKIYLFMLWCEEVAPRKKNSVNNRRRLNWVHGSMAVTNPHDLPIRIGFYVEREQQKKGEQR